MLKLLFEALVLPPGVFILGFVLATAWVKTRQQRHCLMLFAIALWLASTPYVGDRLQSRLQYEQLATRSHITAFQPDAVVVLVSGVYLEPNEFEQRTVLPNVLQRLRYGVWLAKTYDLPLVLSGNSSEELQYSSAALAADLVVNELGFDHLVLDENSQNTMQHPDQLEPLFDARDWNRLLLVTHGWHMSRALEAFQDSSLRVLPAPMGLSKTGEAGQFWSRWLPNMWSLQRTFHYLHERLHDVYRLFV